MAYNQTTVFLMIYDYISYSIKHKKIVFILNATTSNYSLIVNELGIYMHVVVC